MNYVIVNKSFGVKLDKNGKPISCKKQEAQIFEYSKAKNICNTLPKTMKNLKFHLEAVTDFKTSVKENISELKNTVSNTTNKQVHRKKKIAADEYDIPMEVRQWVDKVRSMNGLLLEAQDRKKELINALSMVDKEKTNIEHEIELFSSLNASAGYKKYRELRRCLLKRRTIKDELSVVNLILDTNIQNGGVFNIDKLVANLTNRTYIYRQIAE